MSLSTANLLFSFKDFYVHLPFPLSDKLAVTHGRFFHDVTNIVLTYVNNTSAQSVLKKRFKIKLQDLTHTN